MESLSILRPRNVDDLEHLLLTLFLRLPSLSVRCWLSLDLPIIDMSLVMLFYFDNAQPPTKDNDGELENILTQRLKKSMANGGTQELQWMFMYEYNAPDKLMFNPGDFNQDFEVAFKLLRAIPTATDEFRISMDSSTTSYIHSEIENVKHDADTPVAELNFEVICRGAIVCDDISHLQKLSKSPLFHFSQPLLNFAARHGCIRCFKFLIANHSPISQATLLNACEGQNDEIFHIVLDAGINPDQQLIDQSIRVMNTATLQWCIMTAHIIPFDTAIQLSIECGNWVAVKILANRDHDSRQLTTNNHLEFLTHTFVEGHSISEILKLEFPNGSENMIDFPLSDNSRYLLKLMIPDNLAIIDAFLNENDRTINSDQIVVAAECNAYATLKTLSTVQSIDTPNRHGQRPLIVALEKGSVIGAQNLIDYGASVDKLPCDSKPPICVALSTATDNHLIDTMVAKKAIAHLPTVYLDGCLLTVAKSDFVNVAEELLDDGADINARDNNDKTPLMLAAISLKAEMVLYLLDKNAETSLVDKYGKTALMYIVSNFVFSSRNEDFNAKCEAGITHQNCPLAKATDRMIELSKSSLNQVDQNAHTAIMYSYEYENKYGFDSLRKAGVNPIICNMIEITTMDNERRFGDEPRN